MANRPRYPGSTRHPAPGPTSTRAPDFAQRGAVRASAFVDEQRARRVVATTCDHTPVLRAWPTSGPAMHRAGARSARGLWRIHPSLSGVNSPFVPVRRVDAADVGALTPISGVNSPRSASTGTADFAHREAAVGSVPSRSDARPPLAPTTCRPASAGEGGGRGRPGRRRSASRGVGRVVASGISRSTPSAALAPPSPHDSHPTTQPGNDPSPTASRVVDDPVEQRLLARERPFRRQAKLAGGRTPS